MAKDSVIRKLENSPLPEVVRNLAVAISEAQFAIDRNTCETFKRMADKDLEITEGKKVSMIELGLLPSFYHFTEANIEAKVAFSMMESHEMSVKAGLSLPIKMVTASIEASYTGKYSFSSEGSSVVSTRIVSVPPPAELTRIFAEDKTEKEA